MMQLRIVLVGPVTADYKGSGLSFKDGLTNVEYSANIQWRESFATDTYGVFARTAWQDVEISHD
jgi:hypothetical protein